MQPEIVIYVKPSCPFCAAMEELFASKGMQYKTIDYYKLSSEELEELDKKTNNWPTAPMVFINGKFHGGFEEVQELNEKGALDKILGKK